MSYATAQKVLTAERGMARHPTRDGVILIHGMAKSPRSMDTMRRRVESEGYATLNIDYPRHMDLEAIASHVADLVLGWIERIEGDVHFITHSMGGLVARILIARHRPLRLGKVVMLGPPNQGSEIADLLSRTWPYQHLLGPAAMRLTTRETAALGQLIGDIDYPVGIIAGSRSMDPVGHSFLPRPNDGKVTVERTKLPGMTDHLVVPATHTFMTRNPSVIAATIRFLRDGQFAESGDMAAPTGKQRPAFQPTRRSLLASSFAVTAALPLRATRAAEPRLVIDDASRMNPTPVAKHIVTTPDSLEGTVRTIRTALREATLDGRSVALGAARHSMGGQSLPRDGTAITLGSRPLLADKGAMTYRIDAGAKWRDVIAGLDPLGCSPAVMQSNNDFGVAGSFSVNAHGWAVPRGPFGCTVRSIRMVLADGTLLECSPERNSDLFRLAMGGYGLFGAIVDLVVEMTPNLLLIPSSTAMPAETFVSVFLKAAHDRDIHMAYGRLSPMKNGFFEEAILTTYASAPVQPATLPPPTHSTRSGAVMRDLYRAQVGREHVKSARWMLEKDVGPTLSAHIAQTRNMVMNWSVKYLEGNDPCRTDILHEYFIPPDRFGDFLTICKDVIPRARAEFLNVTLRYVAQDPLSLMRYAPQDRIAAVMSFSQDINDVGEADMMVLTETLIEGVLSIGGSFYLPYRLHARRDQVERAYPSTTEFVKAKRAHDPSLLFRNAMWDRYFS